MTVGSWLLGSCANCSRQRSSHALAGSPMETAAPIGYLFRPYVVYRTRDAGGVGNRAPRRGWDRTKV